MASVSAHGLDWRSRAERGLIETADPGTDPESRQTERDRLPVRTRYRRGGSCHPSPWSGRSCCKSSNTTPSAPPRLVNFRRHLLRFFPCQQCLGVAMAGSLHSRPTSDASRTPSPPTDATMANGKYRWLGDRRGCWVPPSSTWQHPLTTGHHDCYTFGASRGSPLFLVHRRPQSRVQQDPQAPCLVAGACILALRCRRELLSSTSSARSEPNIDSLPGYPRVRLQHARRRVVPVLPKGLFPYAKIRGGLK